MNVKLLIFLLAASSLWAAAPAPQPQVKSAAEIAWEAIPDTIPDAEQVRIAREYLDNNPNDIPLLRSVQNILNRKSDLTIDFWTERMNANPTSANRYLYARKTGDPEIMKTQADQIMKDDPSNFWGYYLGAVAEWSKEKPDMSVVTNYFEQAIAKDPSRPEGWSYGAQAYENAKDWDNALRLYDAMLTVKPDDKDSKMGKMGIYAQKRDADNYFKMSTELLTKEPPLAVDMKMHNSSHNITTADLTGQYSVVEMFTYW
jgi:tetratricopeptide (TPR) repeat protein